MTDPVSPRPTETVASFFKRLEAIDAVLRIIVSQAKISALFTLRGDPEKKVLLDFSKSPTRVVLDEQAKDVDVLVTIRGEVMHDVLSGHVSAGEALGRRELLLRGSSSNLARLIPLFDFAPVLYREHLEQIGFEASHRQSVARALEARSMDSQSFDGNPISLVHLSGMERLVFGMLKGVAYGLGYTVGFLRYRIFEKLNLFDVLSAMSHGLAAAAARGKPEGGNLAG